MRTRLVLSFLGLCLISILAVPANAQFNRRAQFQPWTDDELKMTSDPKAPGADAVYLNVEEYDNDPLHFQSFYVRIKVLTEKGKDLATVELPYVPEVAHISNIKARTIHPDGKVVPLDNKTIEDIVAAKSKGVKLDRVVFNLPSVEVGSILEYQYEITYLGFMFQPPKWEVQKKYLVHKAHYQFAPQGSFLPNGKAHQNVYNLGDTKQQLGDYKGRIISSLLWWYKLPEGVQVQINNDGYYTLDVSDIPPAPDEEWMPPIESVLMKVLFYYNYSANPQQFWGGEARDWSKDVDHFAEPTQAIRDAVNKLIATTDKDEDKARKLYAAVQALDNTDYSRKRSASEMKTLKINAAKRAEDTLNQKSGNSADIALLYMAMARAAGLQAYAIIVVPRDRGFFDTSYMSFGQLRDTLVLVGIDGKGKLLDPGEKMCPFGTVNWRNSSASGFRQGTDGLGKANTPRQDYSKNTVDRAGDITVDAHGAVTGQISITMTGQEALAWRQTALRNDEAEVKKQFDRTLEKIVPEGVEGHIDHFVGLSEPESDLLAVVKISGTMGAATSKRLILPGAFFEAREPVPFVKQEKRLMPIDMQYGDVVSDEITYHLPEGMRVEGAPADTRFPWAGHATYALKSVSAPGTVTVSRALSRAFDMLQPDEYDTLRGFYQKVASADQQQLVLTTAPASAAPAGSGN
jgi:hypothetical protein